MAGQIIISNIKTDSDNAFSILANTGAVLFSANLASGITTGIVDGSVTNAKLAGSITGDKIATGQITGNLIATNAISQNNIVSVNASVVSVGTLPKTRLPAGSVLQVVSNTKTDTFSTTSTSYVDITGLSVSITPISATSKIFITVDLGCSAASGTRTEFQLVRNSTAIGIGDDAGSRTRGNAAVNPAGPAGMVNAGFSYLDSPATTSATTYKVQIAFIDNSGTTYINRTVNDEDAASRSRTSSTITVMEIAA